jgi:acetylornithine deacetylase/succinyl-diaminopimelate desuccinylase-like protein
MLSQMEEQTTFYLGNINVEFNRQLGTDMTGLDTPLRYPIGGGTNSIVIEDNRRFEISPNAVRSERDIEEIERIIDRVVSEKLADKVRGLVQI